MSELSFLSVGGPAASEAKRWTYDELRALPAAAQIPDVGVLVPGRRGSGVRVSALVERSRPTRDARHVHVASTDPAFAVSLAITELAPSAVVVYSLDGAPLDAKSGGPFRLLVPGHPDECVNVKALARLELAASPGRDTRPIDDAEHAKLHQKKKA